MSHPSRTFLAATIGAVLIVAMPLLSPLSAQSPNSSLSISERTAESAQAFADAVGRAQLFAIAIAAATFGITAGGIAGVSRGWWVSAPIVQWLVLVFAPALAAGAVGKTSMLSLREVLDAMPEQSLRRVLEDPQFYGRTEIDQAVRYALRLKPISEQGTHLFWWALSYFPVLIAAALGTIGCLVLWLATNRRVIRGRQRA